MTRARAAAIAVGLVAVLGGACGVDDQSELSLPDRELGAFAADVQPFVGSGCGSLDCHGDPGRALRLYARFGLRDRVESRGEPPSDAELQANLSALSALSDDVVLGKPLAVGAGGLKHVGGDLWSDRQAPEHRCLAAWLAGDSDGDACVAAAERARY